MRRIPHHYTAVLSSSSTRRTGGAIPYRNWTPSLRRDAHLLRSARRSPFSTTTTTTTDEAIALTAKRRQILDDASSPLSDFLVVFATIVTATAMCGASVLPSSNSLLSIAKTDFLGPVDSLGSTVISSSTSPSASSSSPSASASSASPSTPASGKASITLSVHAKRGPRASMEDRWFVSDDFRFFGVFDGHGGVKVAEMAQHHLYEEYVKALGEIDDSSSSLHPTDRIVEALSRSFANLSRTVLGNPKLDLEGSTAVVVVMLPDEIVTANIGDSRAVLCRGTSAVDITTDHKPNSPPEKRRIEELGGVVRWHGYLGPDRLPVPGMGAFRINGNLAVSRALGDRLEVPFVSSEPEIKRFTRNLEEDRFIILASDGLWDVITSQEAVDFVRQISSVPSMRRYASDSAGHSASTVPPVKRDKAGNVIGKKENVVKAEMDTRKHRMAQYLCDEALRRGSADNVTCLIVWLK